MTPSKTQSTSSDSCIVLIVSQDTKAPAAWELIFKQKGYCLVQEKTPRHALQAARLLHPSLVIIDLDLHPLERLSLCRELRPVTNGALIVLAPKVNEDEAHEYDRVGVDERLSPSVAPTVLLSKSLAWLS